MTAGVMDMFPEELEPQLKALTETGTTLAGSWAGAKGDISAAETGIGSGPLGQAFRANYQPATEAVRGTADPVPDQFRTVAEAGTQGVQDYRTADTPGRFRLLE
ncbi:MAG TPA: hypothetical protein VGD34_22635 [Kribbella sp.]